MSHSPKINYYMRILNTDKKSHKIAIISGEKQVSYKSLWDDINKINESIMVDIPGESRVGLMVDNSYESIVCMYGIF